MENQFPVTFLFIRPQIEAEEHEEDVAAQTGRPRPRRALPLRVCDSPLHPAPGAEPSRHPLVPAQTHEACAAPEAGNRGAVGKPQTARS